MDESSLPQELGRRGNRGFMLKSYAVHVVLNPTFFQALVFAVWRRTKKKTVVVVGNDLSWGEIAYSGTAVCNELELWALQGFIERRQPDGWACEGSMAQGQRKGA